MSEEKQTSQKPNELIIQHFILGVMVFFQAIIKVFNLIVPNPKTNGEFKYNSVEKINGLDPGVKHKESPIILNKSNYELKQILKDVDLFSSLTKGEIIELIVSNKEALKTVNAHIRKERLTNMKNEELRSMLKGVDGISRFKKSELVEMILNQEALKQ